MVERDRVILCKDCRFFQPNGCVKNSGLSSEILFPTRMGYCMNPDSKFYRGLKNGQNGCSEKELQNCEVFKL